MKERQIISVFVTVLILLQTKNINAQAVDSAILKHYSPSIVVKVYEVISRTKKAMPLSRQKIFANFFKSSDSSLAALIKVGASQRNIDSIGSFNLSKLDALFSAQEKFDYYTAPKMVKRPSPIPFCQMALAVKKRDSLGLSAAVVDSLHNRIHQLDRMINSFYKNPNNHGKSFDFRPFESAVLNNLFTDQQYTAFLSIKNRKKAANYAAKDWKELQLRKLDGHYGKDTTLQKLTAYYLAKQNNYDRYAYDQLKLNAQIKVIAEHKPVALKALVHARKSPKNDTIGQSFEF
jgi:hypothetical protein